MKRKVRWARQGEPEFDVRVHVGLVPSATHRAIMEFVHVKREMRRPRHPRCLLTLSGARLLVGVGLTRGKGMGGGRATFIPT